MKVGKFYFSWLGGALHINLCNTLTPQIKGFQIHVPCIFQHRETSKCTQYALKSRESGRTSEEASHFHQSNHCLDGKLR